MTTVGRLATLKNSSCKNGYTTVESNSETFYKVKLNSLLMSPSMRAHSTRCKMIPPLV